MSNRSGSAKPDSQGVGRELRALRDNATGALPPPRRRGSSHDDAVIAASATSPVARRSSLRRRDHVSYAEHEHNEEEDAIDDDDVSPLKQHSRGSAQASRVTRSAVAAAEPSRAASGSTSTAASHRAVGGNANTNVGDSDIEDEEDSGPVGPPKRRGLSGAIPAAVATSSDRALRLRSRQEANRHDGGGARCDDGGGSDSGNDVEDEDDGGEDEGDDDGDDGGVGDQQQSHTADGSKSGSRNVGATSRRARELSSLRNDPTYVGDRGVVESQAKRSRKTTAFYDPWTGASVPAAVVAATATDARAMFNDGGAASSRRDRGGNRSGGGPHFRGDAGRPRRRSGGGDHHSRRDSRRGDRPREHYDSSSESGRSGSDSMPGGPLDSSDDDREHGRGHNDARGGALDESLLEGFRVSGGAAGKLKGAGGYKVASSSSRKRGFGAGPGVLSGGGGDDEEAEFQAAQERRRADDLAAIRPVGGGGGGGGDFKYNKRDVARADAEPVAVDSGVTFGASVGGLAGHVRALKEMVTLPLLYPELFTRFGVRPPRGVLFHGPPGTGKTLVARALANQASAGGTRISFFMVKGAQLLSKWLGESERQLRLIFEQARRLAPSIIFFDEIDGVAPVRSSKQDAIHSSIVATLLALMDGLDDRGQVIVIGATNRPDAIDPALRRPGRFDRELYFPLPPVGARREILDIHTREWSPPLTPEFKDALARATAGYCGADISALCAEAALRAVRRRFASIYNSEAKLKIDPGTANVTLADFASAMRDIVPAAARSIAAGLARPLPPHLVPLLRPQLDEALTALTAVFPFAAASAGAMVPTGGGAAAAAAASRAAEDDDAAGGGYASDNSAAMAAVYGHLNADECTTCGREGNLACCDSCPAAYHIVNPTSRMGAAAAAAAVAAAVSAASAPSAASPALQSTPAPADPSANAADAPAVLSLSQASTAAGAPAPSSDVAAAAASSAEVAAAASSRSTAAAPVESAAPLTVPAPTAVSRGSRSGGGGVPLHPGSCIPLSCPLPDVLDDSPWACPSCMTRAIPKAIPVDADAVLAAAGKRLCCRPRLVLWPAASGPHKSGTLTAGSAFAAATAAARDALADADADGPVADGSASVVAAAILHAAEALPSFTLDSAALAADSSSRSTIEALALRVAEARRSAPSILLLPRADEWWEIADEATRVALASLLASIPSELPVLLLVTLARASSRAALAPALARVLQLDVSVGAGQSGQLQLRQPSTTERHAFFSQVWAEVLPQPSSLLLAAAGAATGASPEQQIDLAVDVARRRAERRDMAARRDAAPLQVAPPPPPPAPPSAAELAKLKRAQQERDEKYLSALRLGLRSVLDDLARHPKYRAFASPVDAEEVTDYYTVIAVPIDLGTMADKVEAGAYISYEDFRSDLRLLSKNASDYNPATDRDPRGRRLVRNAAAMLDFADLEIADYNRRTGGKLLARCAAIRARRAADGELPDQRKFSTWGVPSGAARDGITEAAIITRINAAYGCTYPVPGNPSAPPQPAGKSDETGVTTAPSATSVPTRITRRSAPASSLLQLASLPDVPRRKAAAVSGSDVSAKADAAAVVHIDGDGDSASNAQGAAAGANDSIEADDTNGSMLVEVVPDSGAVAGYEARLPSEAVSEAPSSSEAVGEVPLSSDAVGEAPSSSQHDALLSSLPSTDVPEGRAADEEPPSKRPRLVPEDEAALSVPPQADAEVVCTSGPALRVLPTQTAASVPPSPVARAAGGRGRGAALADKRAAAAIFNVEAELASMRAAVAEYEALAPRSSALLTRLVAITAGWSLEALERTRHAVAARASTFAREARALARAKAAATGPAAVPSRKQLLDQLECDIDAIDRAAYV